MDDRLVQQARLLGAGRGDAPDDLGGVAHAEDRIAGVDALGGERQEVVPSHVQAALFEQRQDDPAGRARRAGGLQHDQHAGMELRGQAAGRGFDEAVVGALARAEGRWDADDGRVRLGQGAVVGGCP